jgi:thioesterase domain-containing protein
MLGGWCAHGLLALETAQQLRAQGQQIALLVLLEAVNPERLAEYTKWKRYISRMQLKFHLLKFERAYLQQLSGAQARDYVATRISRKFSKLKTSLRRALGTRGPRTGQTGDNPLEMLYAAAASYRPKPYGGAVVLVRSTERTYGFASDLRLGWGSLLGANLEVRESPGNHYTIYTGSNVPKLVAQISSCLREAERQSDSTRKVAAV